MPPVLNGRERRESQAECRAFAFLAVERDRASTPPSSGGPGVSLVTRSRSGDIYWKYPASTLLSTLGDDDEMPKFRYHPRTLLSRRMRH
jgi:hypothetical protein